MAHTIGRLVNVYKGDTSTGTLIATGRTKTVAINRELIDFSDDNSDAWRESAAEPSTRSLDVTVEGLLDLADRAFLTDSLAETQDTYTLQWADNSELTSSFNITSYEESGEHTGEVTFSVTLASSGVVTFTAGA